MRPGYCSVVKTRFCLSMATPTRALNWPGPVGVAVADIGQQLAFAVEDLNAVLEFVGDPDVPVGIDGNAFGRAKYPGPSPAFPKVLMKLPSASKISTRLFRVSVT